MEFEDILLNSRVSYFITPVINACEILEPDNVSKKILIETIDYLIGEYISGDIDSVLSSREIVKEYCRECESDINKAILCAKAGCDEWEIWDILYLSTPCSLTTWLLDVYSCDLVWDMEAWGDLANWIDENDKNTFLFEEHREELIDIFSNSMNDDEILEKLIKLSERIEEEG